MGKDEEDTDISHKLLGGERLLHLIELGPHIDKVFIEGRIFREGFDKIGRKVNHGEGFKGT